MSSAAALQLEGLDAYGRFEHAAMATSFVFHLRSDTLDAAALRAAADEAFRAVDRLEDRLSFYREGSDVSRINRAREGESLRISDDTFTCLVTALEVSALSQGAFDPFAGAPALAAKGQPVPSHLLDRPATDPPGTPCLAVDPDSLTVTRLAGRRWLDLGAVGKGHALDAAADTLREWGVESGLLVAGGSSVLAFGPGPAEGGTWPLTLVAGDGRRPLRMPAPFALGASGEGFQPGHLVRAPAASPASPRRTYALAPTAALADALSTALWVLAPADRPAFAAACPDTSFLVEPLAPAERAWATGALAAEPPVAPACLLVIPCWREVRRLPRFLPALCAAVQASGLAVEIQPADDGSPPAEADATAAYIETLRPRFAALRPLVRLEPHGGKGAAILRGWAEAPAGTAWLAFVDADGSVPAADTVRLIGAALARGPADAVVAADRRHHDPTHPVTRLRRRAWISAVFAWWSRWRLRHDAHDPQCGCKIVPAALVRSRTWAERGYGLDLELLVAARQAGLPVVNLPVAWHEMPASRLRLKDLFSMLQTIERLRITARASSGPATASSSSTP